jgi:deoxyribonuclease V
VASVFLEGELVEQKSYSGACSLPYVSGLFYLLEGPFATEAVRRIEVRPQLLCFDAHGAAHPRAAGLATICGIVLGIPSLGMAKSPLVGTVLGPRNGLGRMVYDGRTVGFVSEKGGAKRYWSPGYSVSLRELRSIIDRYASVCLRAMAESDRASRALVRAG